MSGFLSLSDSSNRVKGSQHFDEQVKMRGNTWPDDRDSNGSIGGKSRVSEGLSFLSLLFVTLIIAVIPWILGGAIPQASLVLQSGAVLASLMAMGSMFLSRQFPVRLPMSCLPLLGFCVIGLMQLMPVYSHPALVMQHAVLPALAKELPATQEKPGRTSSAVRSVMPDATRLSISQTLSLALLSITLFEMARTRHQMLMVIVGLVFSGCGMSALALSQQFGAVEVIIGNHWKVSPTPPFGCFVNPNNAAGWLMVCLSGSLLLCGVTFGRELRPGQGMSRLGASRKDAIWLAWQNFVGRIADVNTVQLLAAGSAILLIAGVAATLSRAGIIAAILGFVAFVLSRFKIGRWFFALCSLSLILIFGCLFLVLLDLDTIVLSELQTLKDPVSESTGRLLHWTDSLSSCLDFPILGSGLGGYRYGSLPYQRHYTGKWFQRADNQYVEVLVESGLLGFGCLIAFAVIALMLIREVLSSKIQRQRSKTGGLLGWSASAVLCSVVALSGAAFFDYGVSLPSVAGAFVVLVVLLERQAVDSRESGSDSRRTRHEPAAPSAGPFVAAWILLVVSVAILIPDTFSAARISAAVAPVERQLNRPVPEVLSETGDQLLSDLNAALLLRPDDLDGLRVRVLFQELLFRNEILKRIAATREMTPAQQENTFRTLTAASLADRVLNPEMPEEVRSEIRNEMNSILEKYPWRKSAQNLLQESAFSLNVSTSLAFCHFLLGDNEMAEAAVNNARFSEPHGARGLFLMGHALLQLGKVDACRTCWNQSLSASESFRPAILSETARILGSKIALEWFLPNSYEACVKAAMGIRTENDLRQKLFELADEFWTSSRPRLTESLAVTRASHLEATGECNVVTAWLTECLLEMPYNLRVRKQNARQLEKCGKNSEAYDEWLRIQAFDPSDKEAENALKRLIQLPPTTERR